MELRCKSTAAASAVDTTPLVVPPLSRVADRATGMRPKGPGVSRTTLACLLLEKEQTRGFQPCTWRSATLTIVQPEA